MRRLSLIFILSTAPALGTQIANVDYVHKYIYAQTGVLVPANETNLMMAANAKYLLCAIDRANTISPRSHESPWCDYEQATTQAVDTAAVADIVARRFNCNMHGYYKPSGTNFCSDCGIGYYCPSASNARIPCTYGAMACAGVNHYSNDALPAAAQGKTDKALTYGEVLALVPQTSISQWGLVRCCHNHTGQNYASDIGCLGTIGPGTYAFIRWYDGAAGDAPSHSSGSRSNAIIAIFDKPVGYQILHGHGIFDIFIDTNHAAFQSYTWHTPAWSDSIDATNISGLEWTNLQDCRLGIWVLE
ncbi:MAG: hypothetical protein LBB08_00520 [Rickettsiales bacterium]|jgi:hypothetical protein|nr:hypothetical protein [Rickettsiales bacterium]